MNTKKVNFSVVDTIAILILLLLGVVFYTGFWMDIYLAILRPPILLSNDWQDSNMRSFYKGSIDNGIEYKVKLSKSYPQGSKTVWVHVEQTTTWYISSQDAYQVSQKPENNVDRDRYDVYSFYRSDGEESFFDGFYEVSFPTELTIPSSLKCRDWDESHRTCVYFGNYEHLFTQIWFMCEGKNALIDSVMNDLIEKAVKTMLEASPPES